MFKVTEVLIELARVLPGKLFGLLEASDLSSQKVGGLPNVASGPVLEGGPVFLQETPPLWSSEAALSSEHLFAGVVHLRLRVEDLVSSTTKGLSSRLEHVLALANSLVLLSICERETELVTPELDDLGQVFILSITARGTVSGVPGSVRIGVGEPVERRGAS